MHRKTLLSAAIVSCLAFSAHAQEATPNATDLDTVVVTGIRASLEKSLDTKRNNDTVSESITAEDIGKFPNTNAAEAMALIPGVTIDRRFGQGERVSIDGTDPSLNLSFIDGHPVAQAIWLYGESPNRGFDYTMLAPEVLGRLEIIKSSEARLPEGSLGGTVMMHSRKPLDMDANSVSGSVGYSYNDQAEKGSPNISVLYSWKNDDSTWGVNVAAQRHEEKVDRQGIEIFGYSTVADFAAVNPNVAAQIAKGELRPTDRVAQEINVAYFQQERKRDSALVNLQFKPNDQFEGTLSGLYIKENFDSYNQSMYNFMTQNNSSMQAVDYFNPTGPGGFVTGGHTNANPGSGTGIIYDNQVRFSEVTTKGVDLDLQYRGDGWKLGGKIGTSKSENPNISQYLIEPVYSGAYTWDYRKGFQADDQADYYDPANWGNIFGNNGVFSSEAKDKYAQLDFSKNFDSIFNQLLVGVRRTEHTENYGLGVYGGVRTGTLADVGTIGNTNLLGSLGGIFGNTSQHPQVGQGNVIDWVHGSPVDYSRSDASSLLNNTWELEQKTTAAYTQLNFSTGALRGNVGLRWVQTKTDSSAYVYGDNQPVLPAPAEWWQTSKSKKSNMLPSVNLVYDNGGDVVLRASAAKVIAWAPYNLMSNNLFLNDTMMTGSGGNPDLDPYKAYNFNFSAEWYFAPQSVLAGSVFLKQTQNYVLQTPGTERRYNSMRDSNPTTWLTTVGSHGCTADGFCDYSVTRPRNAGGASVRGFNVNYQQAFGDTGLGLIANYTYATGDTDAGNNMPYLSRSTVSVSPYFENEQFSARVNYNWRSKYEGVGYVAGAPAATTAAYADLSASLGWNFTDNLSLSLDAMNLLNEKYRQYVAQEEALAAEYFTGRRYMANLRFKF